ncbi:MAG: ABC transporter permease [bacterium]
MPPAPDKNNLHAPLPHPAPIMNPVIKALHLIFSLDPEVLRVAALSLYVSTAAAALASAAGIPLGYLIGISRFPGKRTLVLTLNSLMALPTVLVGLLLFFLLTRNGPLGSLRLLYTPGAIVIGEFVLILPILTMLSVAATSSVDRALIETAATLNASPLSVMKLVLAERRFAYTAAAVTGFGRAVSEVGIAIMVGGNIAGYTRTLTSAVALETSRGEFEFGIALGFVLLAVAAGVNLALHLVQGAARA